MKFNSDVVFIDTSGQVRTITGDLTLRANPDGDGHIIVGSGVSLRPEVDCDALDAMDLGQDGLRWKTLFVCSGNFLERPTVNGSGVLLQGETVPASVAAGVDSINGLSGIVNIVGVSGIDVLTSGQNVLVGVVFGSEAERFAADTEQQTTSTTFQTAFSASTHLLPSGVYRVGWSYDYRCDAADRSIETRLQVNGLTIHNPNQDIGHGQDLYYSTGGFAYVWLGGTVSVQFAFRRGGSSGNHRVRNIHIEIWRVKA